MADLVHYVIVRADLTHGQQLAQTVHAVGESHGGIIHPPGTISVVLHVPDEIALRSLYAKLRDAGLNPSLIEECDGQAMSIGIPPTSDRKSVRRYVGYLPLAK